MQRGRAAAPLPRLRCITPHILHVALNGLAISFTGRCAGVDPGQTLYCDAPCRPPFSENETQFSEPDFGCQPRSGSGNVLVMFQNEVRSRTARLPSTAAEVLQRSLSDLPDWWLVASCCHEKSAGLRWFMARCGDQRMSDFIGRLSCSECRCRPRTVYVQDAPYYRPSVAGSVRIYLVGSEPGEE